MLCQKLSTFIVKQFFSVRDMNRRDLGALRNGAVKNYVIAPANTIP